ncbi:MAG: tetratricopeptide repeat protein [Gemmatimonadales bacterium]
MSRYFAVPVFALTAMVAACGRSDRQQTTSTTAGANPPVVSGSTTGSDSIGDAGAKPAPVTYARAESTFNGGKYGEATQLFSAYTESDPENAWGYYMLGISAWKNGEPDRALTAFDRSIELDPNHRKSLYNSGRVLLEMGRPQQALERIEKALSQEPVSSEGLRLLGRTRYILGQVDEAIEAYHRALAIDDRDVWAMNNLGLIYIDQNQPNAALPALARAVQLKGNAPVFQNNMGVALERSGYPEAAAHAYESAVQVDSTYRKAAVALARVTGLTQETDSVSVDLNLLAQQFEREIESWKGSGSEITQEVLDSTAVASDSSTASIETKGDSVEGSEHEE